MLMTLPINTITSVLNVSTHIITTITDCPTGLAVILAVIFVPTLVNAVILYVYSKYFIGRQLGGCNLMVEDGVKHSVHSFIQIMIIILKGNMHV